MREASHSALRALINTLEDSHDGFEQTAERLRGSGYGELSDRMFELSKQRERFSQELKELAAIQGIDIDESGSAAGALHRGWMKLTASLSGDDPGAVLAEAEAGEEHAKRRFRQTLGEPDLNGRLREVIARQEIEIAATHREVRVLRDHFHRGTEVEIS